MMSYSFEFITYENLSSLIISIIVVAAIFLTEKIVKRLITRFSEKASGKHSDARIEDSDLLGRYRHHT